MSEIDKILEDIGRRAARAVSALGAGHVVIRYDWHLGRAHIEVLYPDGLNTDTLGRTIDILGDLEADYRGRVSMTYDVTDMCSQELIDQMISDVEHHLHVAAKKFEVPA